MGLEPFLAYFFQMHEFCTFNVSPALSSSTSSKLSIKINKTDVHEVKGLAHNIADKKKKKKKKETLSA